MEINKIQKKFVQILDLLSDFKNKHPEDFDKIVDILKEILDEYEKIQAKLRKFEGTFLICKIS